MPSEPEPHSDTPQQPKGADQPPSPQRPEAELLVASPQRKLSIIGSIVRALALFLVFTAPVVFLLSLLPNQIPSLERTITRNSMQQITLAAHEYNDAHGGLPTNSYSPTGEPLLSWRVHLLPYLGEDKLYQKFKLDEPWDGPNNINLLTSMPAVYATPRYHRGDEPRSTRTFYRGFSSAGAVFARKNLEHPDWDCYEDQLPIPVGISLDQMLDGTFDTIFIIEAGESVEWTKPEDLDASPGKPFPKLGAARPKSTTIYVCTCSGSVRSLTRDTSETLWRALITHSGGELVPYE